MEKIKILTTGGTIDDHDREEEGYTAEAHQSFIAALLAQARVTAPFAIQELMKKDSRDVTDEDRTVILKACQDAKEERLIITHGTVTMTDTAKYLGTHKIQKTIVLLGSAIPANKEKSDALFNLGYAFAAAQHLPHGVYVAMNGQIFNWDNVKKEKGYFSQERI